MIHVCLQNRLQVLFTYEKGDTHMLDAKVGGGLKAFRRTTKRDDMQLPDPDHLHIFPLMASK